jgi:exopolysaccharide biosynthesis polyprenyl glycosylphosphotransferase
MNLAGQNAPPRARPFSERVLIVGLTALSRELIGQLESRAGRYEIVGIVAADHELEGPDAPYPVLGPPAHLTRITERTQPDRIIVALSERRERLPVHELLDSRIRWGTSVEDAVDVYERLTGRLPVEHLPPSSIIFSTKFRASSWYCLAGRWVGGIAAALALCVLAPLLAVIAAAIVFDSPGPIFFVQERAGAFGRPFKLIKFRTMSPRQDRTSEWVADNEDRITRVGRWLRRLRADELPQLINVLKGEMSLIGPRPHPVSNLALLNIVARNLNDRTGVEVPYYPLRSMVRPGITGWAQIRYGYANNLDEEMEKLRYDLYYIKHMSPWLDLIILLQTVRVMLTGRGSGAVTPASTSAPAAAPHVRPQAPWEWYRRKRPDTGA